MAAFAVPTMAFGGADELGRVRLEGTGAVTAGRDDGDAGVGAQERAEEEQRS